jgi:D-3-phosphoglycerate dehydrogenase
MIVAFLDPLEDRLRDFPARYLPAPEFEVLLPPAAGQLPDHLDEAEAIVWTTTPVDRALIERLPRLRFLQRIGYFRAAGDATAALERGIPVAVTPYGVSDRVAQHALTLILSLVRQIPASVEALLEGKNPDRLPEEEMGAGARVNWARVPGIASLNDKTVGILGFGEIGACLARLLLPFCCRVLAYRRRPLSEAQQRFYGVEQTDFDTLLRAADIVVSFVPYTPEARGMMGAREFGLMKPTAYFVNCGRGGTVDERALVQALREQRIAGAGLDVFTIEPLPMTSPLRELRNVLLTPHSAGGIGGWEDTFARLRENLLRVQEGRPVILPMQPGDLQPV